MSRQHEWELLCAELSYGSPILKRAWALELGGDLAAIRREVLAGRAGARARQAAVGAGPAPADVVLRSDPDMPPALLALDRPPIGVHTRGDRDLLGDHQLRVGIVGSRHPRAQARDFARQLAGTLARQGVVVVSGLAIGIDGAAHQGAVDAAAPTIAVLGSGLDRIHPSRHRQLAQQIVDGGGLLISEYGSDGDARAHRFPERNRLIAALVDVLVVVQARPASGSMITANQALELGKEVGVVPSYVGDVAFEGSLALLRDGARTVIDATSVLRLLGMADCTSSDLHQFGSYLDAPRSPGELARVMQQPLLDVAAELAQLEQEGLVRRTDDGRFVNAGAGGSG